MTYEEFLNVMMSYKSLSEDFSELYKMGFDFFEGKYQLESKVERMLNATLSSHFTDEGIDWITWFIYENDWGEKDWSSIPTFDKETGKIIDKDPVNRYGAHDENDNPICYSFESTYEYVKQYLKHKTNE
jgi:hypothetical protein